MMTAARPDLIVAEDGRRLAAYDGNGAYWLRGRPTGYAAEVWLRRAGGASALLWPDGSVEANGRRLSCDGLGCMLVVGGRRIALPEDARALDDDCVAADAVIALIAVRGWRRTRTCDGIDPIVDRIDLRRYGTHVVYVRPTGFDVRSSRAAQGDRPWSTGRPPRWWSIDAQ
jgi:competence protein ComEC